MAIYSVTYTCWGPFGVKKAAAVIRAAVTMSMKNTGNVDAMMVKSNLLPVHCLTAPSGPTVGT